jgi:hypothetical protein
MRRATLLGLWLGLALLSGASAQSVWYRWLYLDKSEVLYTRGQSAACGLLGSSGEGLTPGASWIERRSWGAWGACSGGVSICGSSQCSTAVFQYTKNGTAVPVEVNPVTGLVEQTALIQEKDLSQVLIYLRDQRAMMAGIDGFLNESLIKSLVVWGLGGMFAIALFKSVRRIIGELFPGVDNAPEPFEHEDQKSLTQAPGSVGGLPAKQSAGAGYDGQE